MNKKNGRKVLGRGLSNLIPVNVNEESNIEEIHDVSITAIKTNPFQPRFDFNEDDIVELAESIKNQGLLQPVVVRKKNEFYEIISGERRFRAFKHLQKDSVPCIVKFNVTDREMLELALIENIQREELNEIEKALAFQKLLIEYNYTHEQLSEHVGKSRTAITNALRLLNLPEEIQLMVRKNQISMGHARALLTLSVEEQIATANKIINDNLSVRDVENLNNLPFKKRKTNSVPTTNNASNDVDFIQIIDQLQYKFGTSVTVEGCSKKKGKISFVFFGKDDLSRIIDLFLK
jgi:ParB family transcriptional regulator, chromosome partitioning protein